MLPTARSIRDITVSHKKEEVSTIDALTTFVGEKIHDSAKIGLFQTIVRIPSVMLFKPSVPLDISITIISKRLRLLGYTVRRIHDNCIMINWDLPNMPFTSSSVDGSNINTGISDKISVSSTIAKNSFRSELRSSDSYANTTGLKVEYNNTKAPSRAHKKNHNLVSILSS